ncbi:NAD-binding protein [Phellopilus nigrolimitatus]|nr:NAD-binding protein [Phellopilus nigrolimitatus]
MDLGFKGTRVLVTGANGGIGLETTRLFLQQGAHVIGHYHSNNETLKSVAADPTTFSMAQANLASESDVVKLFDGFEEKPVQVLVVNHAIFIETPSPFRQLSLEQWNKTLSTNLTSSFLVIREFLRRIESSQLDDSERDKVAVVLVGSVGGKYGEDEHVDYATSKSAMMYGLLPSLKTEIVKVAPKGRANCVAPGWVSTPMVVKSFQNHELLYRQLATAPLKKVATPSDVAHQIVFLASSVASGHVTGQVIMVEGGLEGRVLNKFEEIDFSKI